MTMNSTSPNAPATYHAYEYVQPFQPLGEPGFIPPPPYTYDDVALWSAPTPTSAMAINPRQPGPQVRFMCGSPQSGLQPSQAPNNFGSSFIVNNPDPHGKTHRSRQRYSRRKRSRYCMPPPSGAIAFPEPQHYPSYNYSPPPPYPSSPPMTDRRQASSAPGVTATMIINERSRQPGLSADEIPIQPEHCTYLVDAVKEMSLCNRIFATWVEQMDKLDLSKKDGVEADIANMITGLADDSLKMLNASRNILASYKALARLMDRRLSAIASSRQGGDLFSPSMSSSKAQARDDFQMLSLDIHVHSAEISACVEKMHDRLLQLRDTAVRAHDKYSFRRRLWGWVCHIFRSIAQVLFIGGAVSSLAHPVGTVGTAAMHVGSGLATVVASVCEKIKESYHDEEKGLNEVLKLLQGKIPKSMHIAQAALLKFNSAHSVFREYSRVESGRASGRMAPAEAARAQSKWHKAAKLLELKDSDTFNLNIDSMSW